MKLTLLLDLDGTLLDTNLDAFIPAYFQKLAAHMSARIPPETLIKSLMVGTRAMMANDSPTIALKAAFDQNFYPLLGFAHDELVPDLNQFYDEVFPSLRGITKPVSGAVELIEWAFAAGHRVVIATSPLFPWKAVHHRLRWAGLQPEKYPFALISSYEHFHFLKPHPAYFAEVLGRLGWPEDPVVMVGNDVEQDLKPAAALGLATYHSLDTASADGFPATGRGLLSELRAWLEQTDPATLVPDYSTPAALLAVLRSTPAVLAGLLEPLAPASLARRPAEKEWAINEILCHLRDVEREVHQPRIQQILREDDPFIPGQMTDEWADQRGYLQQDAAAALRDFTSARLGALETLDGLAPAQWSRKTRHAIFGPTSLQELVSFNAEHDRLHIQQIYKIKLS